MSFVPNETCKACGLYANCLNPLIKPEATSDKVDILFVGSFPGPEDDESGRPFSGASGAFFRDFVSHFDGYTFAYTNAVHCWPTDDSPLGPRTRAANDDEIAYCRVYLQEDIQRYDPKVICCLGAIALKSVWPEGPKSIAQARVTPTKVGGRWIVTSYSPIMHTNGQRDLRQDYFSLGKLIDDILSGRVGEQPDIRDASDEDMPQVMKQLAASEEIFFDVETDTWTYSDFPEIKTFYMPGRDLVCCGVGTSTKEPVWILNKEQLESVLDFFVSKKIVAHNILYDAAAIHWFYNFPEIWDADIEDTFLMHVSLDQGYIGNSLDDLSMKYLAAPSWKKEAHDAINDENKRRLDYKKHDAEYDYRPATLADIPRSTLVSYNGRDVYYTIKLYELFKNFELPPAYRKRYLYFVPLLGRTSVRGMKADKDRFKRVQAAYEQKVHYLLESLNKSPEIRKVLEERDEQYFNSRSPLQMTELMRLLEIDTGLTASGKYLKADKKTMKEVVKKHSLMRRVNVIKEMQNLLSKFIEPLQYHVDVQGRIHTFYTLGRVESTFPVGGDPTGGVVTGRISAHDIAAHNLKHELLLRACIGDEEGFTCVEADYGAAEVRGLAWKAGVKNLIKFFEEGIDPYIFVMATQDSIPYEDMLAQYNNPLTYTIIKARRQLTKNAFLAWQYGAGMTKFASMLGTTMSEATRLYGIFDKLFPEVRPYQEDLMRRALNGEMIITEWGVQRLFSINSPHDENALKNYEIQQTMSDVTLWAANQMYLEFNEKDFYITNLVHDAVWSMVRTSKLKEISTRMVEIMRNPPNIPVNIKVKLEVELSFGDNLGQMKKVEI